MKSLKQGSYAPVYLLDGEEPFFNDQITDFFEQHILPPQERDFNLSIFYGKDAAWADVVNACRRFPMFAERQVVILKDAAQMKELDQLVGYVEQPAPTTIFLIEHRFKKLDGRSKLAKVITKQGQYFSSAKLKDESLPDWIVQHCESLGLKLHFQEAQLLAANLGNDLGKVANEIEKLRLNLSEGQNELTTQLIEKHIGVSREYNVFNYPEALTRDDAAQANKMLSYFVASPKSAPAPLMLAALYSHFEKLYMQHSAQGRSLDEVASVLGLTEKMAWKAKEYLRRPQYSRQQVENCLLILAEWSGRAVGIGSGISDAGWLKELSARLKMTLQPEE
ncbi:MAG: DNA polymerase III subunit delta [Bacteroidetes bacterium]|nr:DNA polymerase III subunit delta [Bacteroidota bacterium]MBS1630750.1 DNA polymerase III subunit delta [Bacteroidota bacterium]